MSEETAEYQVVKRDGGGVAALSLKQIGDRVNLVHQVLDKVMKVNTHFGKVPGCGDKMVLLKPGADVLAMTFRLVPQFAVERSNLEDGHREYDVTCSMYGQDGTMLGQGVGSASTMEKKYRYRWEGSGGSRKRIENEDIADCYNTVLKIAKKRAHIDATLTVTGAADLFTQDLIDEEPEQREPVSMPKAKPTGKAKSVPSGDAQTTQTTVEAVGQKGKRYWLKCEDGEYYSTFSDTIGQDIMALEKGESVVIEYIETTGKGGAVFRNLEAIRLADVEPEPEQDAPDGDDVGF